MNHNKNLIRKSEERKVLRKVKKNWIVVSVISFVLVGGSFIIQNNDLVSAADANQTLSTSAGLTSSDTGGVTNSSTTNQEKNNVDTEKSNIRTVTMNDDESGKSNLSGLQISVLNQQSEITAGSTVNLFVNVNLNSLQTSIKAGDQIKFTIPNDLVDWNSVKQTGGEDYGIISHDATSNTVAFTFSHDLQNKIGSFGFNLFIPIKSDAAASNGNLISSNFVSKDGQTLAIPVTGSTFNIGPAPQNEPLPSGTNRMQAPASGNAFGLHAYTGSDIVINNPVNVNGYSHILSQNVTTDTMTVFDILQPDRDNSKSLTGRNYTFSVDGPNASIDLNSFRFQLPSGSDVVYGKGWGTVSDIQNGLANGTAYPAFQLIQLADNRVQLIIPNGMNIQNLTVIFNIVAPDADGEYKYDQLYKDDQGTSSWNHIITLTWFNPKEIFAPTPKISVPSTKSVMTTDNISDVNAWLKDNVTASVSTSGRVIDLTNDVQIVNDSDFVSAWKNKQPGTYKVTYQVVYKTTIDGQEVASLAMSNGTATIISPSNPNEQVGKLIIHYVDENGNEIAGMPEKQMVGLKGTVYSVDRPEIKGYQYDKSSSALTGIYGDDATISLTYTKNAPAQSTETKTVKEKVTYQFADGQKASDAYEKDVTFTRTVFTDAVTGEVSYGSWSPAQSFSAVTSPSVKGYTADKAEIEAQNVNSDSQDLLFTVTYMKDEIVIPTTAVSKTESSKESSRSSLPETGKHNGMRTTSLQDLIAVVALSLSIFFLTSVKKEIINKS